MIDFEGELKKILNEDPLGILKNRTVQPITTDQRLKDSFEEINKFIDDKGREPTESKDITERKLFSRLKQLRKDFDKWAKGETGIPFIDANMRELNETGFISNRGRQNVASFLAQNLNIDWRMGAEYFESLLLDYDPCSNYGNWAYNATVGHDPRNRYFNILNQAERYDKNGEYVRYWLPELKYVPNEFVHRPHTIPPDQQKLYDIQVGKDYPKPFIDLEKSYEEIKNRE